MEAQSPRQEGRRLAGTVGGASAPPGPSWRHALATAIRDPALLRRRLGLPAPAAGDGAAQEAFPLLVTEHYLGLMEPGDADDPLLRQVLPDAAEGRAAPGDSRDPLAEAGFAAVPGLLRKYRGRALLVATGACAIHCRYCFRRHFPYERLPRGRAWWQDAVAAVAADPDIDELILSGGDPLVLDDRLLTRLVADFAAIGHLRRLRIHTRLPIVLPERVTAGLVGLLASGPLQGVLVLHANHPREVAPPLVASLRPLREHGVTLLNQAVLLAGVNDAVAVQVELAERLFAAGVLPYYLHRLDPVLGSGHFRVDPQREAALLRGMHARLPGYLLPRLVQEVPGLPGKTPIAWWA